MEDHAIDILYDGKEFYEYHSPRIATKNTHGTGCTLSASLAANLANGLDIEQAVASSKQYITVAIENALEIGKGVGPTHHFYELYKKAGLFNES